jgi:hypothetical protein
LRQIDGVVDANGGEDILKLVYEPRCHMSVPDDDLNAKSCKMTRGRGTAWMRGILDKPGI